MDATTTLLLPDEVQTNAYVGISYSGYDLMKLEQLGDTRIMVYNGHREISLALVGR